MTTDTDKSTPLTPSCCHVSGHVPWCWRVLGGEVVYPVPEAFQPPHVKALIAEGKHRRLSIRGINKKVETAD